MGLNKVEFGIAGAIVLLSQSLTSFYSSDKITREIASFKEQFNKSLVDREQFFVRKTDIAPFLSKLDEMKEQLVLLNEKMELANALNDPSLDIVDCSLERDLYI